MVDWCFMCKKSVKTIDHLLLHYEVAKAVWNFVFGLCGLEWVMPRWVVNLYMQVGEGNLVVFRVQQCGR